MRIAYSRESGISELSELGELSDLSELSELSKSPVADTDGSESLIFVQRSLRPTTTFAWMLGFHHKNCLQS